MNNFLEIYGLKKTFPALDKPLFSNLSIKLSESTVFTGVSGSGKSTFLQIIAGLDVCDKGSIKFFGNELCDIKQSDLINLRKHEFGFIYQFHHLLNDFNVLENVMLPLKVNNINEAYAMQQAKKLLNTVGLLDRIMHYPNQLSGGEKQRVAICRALIHKPKVIFADEPTGNLDKKNSKIVLDLLLKGTQQNNIKLLLVTHDQSMLSNFKNRFEFIDGRLKKC
jgi:ABC-type lipoprotein export system ATPase subunit